MFPMGTVPNDTDDGVELRDAACALAVANNVLVIPSKTNKSETIFRWDGPPG